MCANASSSLSTSLSTAPLPCAWTCEPPSSSLLTCSPTPRSTTGGPATKSWLVSLTMSAKCEVTTRAAPRPATEPMQAPTTGTSERRATTTSPDGGAVGGAGLAARAPGVGEGAGRGRAGGAPAPGDFAAGGRAGAVPGPPHPPGQPPAALDLADRGLPAPGLLVASPLFLCDPRRS